MTRKQLQKRVDSGEFKGLHIKYEIRDGKILFPSYLTIFKEYIKKHFFKGYIKLEEENKKLQQTIDTFINFIQVLSENDARFIHVINNKFIPYSKIKDLKFTANKATSINFFSLGNSPCNIDRITIKGKKLDSYNLINCKINGIFKNNTFTNK